MAGRGVTLALPPQLFQRLPSEYSIEPTVRFVPFYFNQGIDIVQTLAAGKNTAERKLQAVSAFIGKGTEKSTSDASSNRAQYEINEKALFRLNDYCHMLIPVELNNSSNAQGPSNDAAVSSPIPIHPSLAALYDIMRYEKDTRKVI